MVAVRELGILFRRSDQLALIKMEGAIRYRSCPRIMSDHHNGLMVIAGQGAEQVENRSGGFPVEVSGGFVGYEESGVVDDGPGNGHPLFLPS